VPVGRTNPLPGTNDLPPNSIRSAL
jgi:hypothetical protein